MMKPKGENKRKPSGRRGAKPARRGAPRRNLFAEMMEGVAAMAAHREGKITLRSYKVDPKPLPAVDAKFIRATRQKLGVSRGVLARKLFTNVRTLENWEQGRGTPNPQASALLRLVRAYPDTLERLESLVS
jgi:putative transcriptional regulator